MLIGGSERVLLICPQTRDGHGTGRESPTSCCPGLKRPVGQHSWDGVAESAFRDWDPYIVPGQPPIPDTDWRYASGIEYKMRRRQEKFPGAGCF